MGNSIPIYYMDVKIKYKKNKSYLQVTNWVVSKYESPIDIMRYDDKTMDRLKDELYGKTKQDRDIIITSVIYKTLVGYGINDLKNKP
jgi:hypothetical protein